MQRVGQALDESMVGLVDRALLECPLQHGVGVLTLGDHHQPTGPDIETMHHSLTLGRTRGRDAIAGRRQPADHRGAGPADAGMGGNADGLVDNHQVVVVMDHDHPGHGVRDHAEPG